MTKQEFIDNIAKYVIKYAAKYNIKVHSPIIAQACLESGYGTSELAINANNFFGLKYKAGRCPTAIGSYTKVGSEQNKDGSYTSSVMYWMKFADMENCVIGYFDFTNNSNYKKLKGVTNPKKYLEYIKAARYATSINYVNDVYSVITSWNLTKYDKMTVDDFDYKELYYRVQCGVYIDKDDAITQQIALKKAGFTSIINHDNNIYKVQVGAYKSKVNADKMLIKVKNKGFEAIITYDGNTSNDDTPKKYIVGNDAGHGSHTAGKRMPNGYREHWINVHCAKYFDMAMKRCGIDTVKVAWDDDNDATDDVDVSLSDRQKTIRNAKCDISVSWHANAYGDGGYNSGEGVETFYHSTSSKSGDSKALATIIQKYLIKGTKQKNRGVKSANFAMCNCSNMDTKASVLIETAFMTNKNEAELLMTDKFCYECAEEAAQGVCEYLDVKYIPSTFTELNIKIGSYEKFDEDTDVPLKINSDVKSIQTFLNTYYADNIKSVLGKLLDVDGKFGSKSKKGITIAFQVELNKLNANIEVDGSFGPDTCNAFNTYAKTLKKGSKGIFVTLWQCLVVGLGYDPKGIDGSFGSGCVTATNKVLSAHGLPKNSKVTGETIQKIL